MSWTKPLYSKSLVDKAGQCLALPGRYEWDREDVTPFQVIGNFRSSHGFALNTYQMALRAISKRNARHFIVAQRLKRIPSIIAKVVDRPGLRLTQIQDIGGCRSIVDGIQSLRVVCERLISGKLKKKLKHIDNYIEHPKADGYRGIHLIFVYLKPEVESPFNNQRIEVQLRTPFQHAWATAVETVDMFNRYRLKSGHGPQEWKTFFCLVGSALASIEGCPLVPGYELSKSELQTRIRESVRVLQVFRRLSGYQVAVKHMDRVAAKKAPGFVLIRLNFKENMLYTRHYAKSENERMNREYVEAEQRAWSSPFLPVKAERHNLHAPSPMSYPSPT